MRRKTKLTALLLSLAVLLSVPGCQNARELNNLLIMSAVGIDKPEEGNKKLRVTAQIVLPAQMKAGAQGGDGSTSGSGGGGANPYFNMENDGDSVLIALRDMTKTIDNKLYATHSNVIIFSRAIAEEGIRAHLDFFSKEVEVRRTALIFIADGSAADVLDAGDVFETLPSVSLDHLAENQKFTSFATAVTLLDISNALLSKTASAVLPIVGVEETNGRKLNEISGLAVFKEDRMIGELDEEEGRGLLFALDKVVYGLTPVRYKDQDVTLEITSASSKLKPRLEGERIIFDLSIKTQSTIMEQSGTQAIDTKDDLNALEALQRAAIQKEIGRALEKAKSLRADIFDFGGLLRKYYPGEWESMESDWEALFQTTEIQVSFDNQIYGIGTVNKPLAPEESS